MDGGRSVPDGARGGVRSSEVGAQSADADGSLPAEADERFMARAVELARRGAGWTSPNPLVGAVIVRDGRIIGEGCHILDLFNFLTDSRAESLQRVAGRCHGLCHLGALLPYGQDAAVHRGAYRGRHCARGRGRARSQPSCGGQGQRGSAAGRHRSGRGGLGAIVPRCQRTVPARHGAAPSPGDSQIRHDLGREGGHAGGAFSLGDRRGGAPPRS